MTTIIKIDRQALISDLIARDGLVCQYPGCEETLDLNALEHQKGFVTIDHWMPQSYGKENGWTYEEIWDLSNLKLMSKKCNARKSDLIPNEDGTLPVREVSTFHSRRAAKVQRPEICTDCNSGRDLDENEWCNACGSGPMPERFPKWRQLSHKECDHDLFFCVSCTIWFPEKRRSALDAIITGGPGYE